MSHCDTIRVATVFNAVCTILSSQCGSSMPHDLARVARHVAWSVLAIQCRRRAEHTLPRRSCAADVQALHRSISVASGHAPPLAVPDLRCGVMLLQRTRCIESSSKSFGQRIARLSVFQAADFVSLRSPCRTHGFSDSVTARSLLVPLRRIIHWLASCTVSRISSRLRDRHARCTWTACKRPAC